MSAKLTGATFFAFSLSICFVLIQFYPKNKKQQKKGSKPLEAVKSIPESAEKVASDAAKAESLRGNPMSGVSISSISLHEIPLLRGKFESADVCNSCGPGYNKIMGGEDFVINDIVRKAKSNGVADAFVRAGPRSFTHFDPAEVRAGIVTCGGLCPGLNNVVRELVHALTHLYQVDHIYGIK